jgi:DNA polymerase I
MKYVVLDLEVDSDTTNKRSLNQLDKYNDLHKIITIQIKRENKPASVLYNREGIDRNIKLNFNDVEVIVGHNLKFDLLWLWENESLRSFLRKGGKIWDTFLAEYILEGHKRQPYKLDNLSKKYGASLKNTDVCSLFANGKKASDIDPDLLISYGKEDVVNTEIIYLKQIERAKKENMYLLLRLWMNHVLYISEVEYNGIYVDLPALKSAKLEQQSLYDSSVKNIQDSAKKYWNDEVEFDYKSNDHISALLFGGKVPTIKDVPNPSKSGELVYKTGKNIGQLRTKKEKVFIDVPGLKLRADSEWESKKEGYFKADKKIISDLLLRKIPGHARELLSHLDIARKTKKLLDYYDLLLECVHSHSCAVHSSFNLCPVYSSDGDIVPPRTGRISSRAPNVQNLHPKSLNLFKSRFENGIMWEIDYSQLEVRVAAALSNDKLLIWEINEGVDLHRENAALLYNKKPEDVTKDERKITKAFTFGLLYGQSYRSMALVHNVHEELAKSFISNFYDKYESIKKWHDDLVISVNRSSYVENSIGYSKLRMPLRRVYTFEDSEAPQFMKDKGILRTIKPTDIKNYPVQGTAATVVSIAAGLLYRELSNVENLKLVNEIHDAILIDCTTKVKDMYYNKVIEIMSVKTTEVIEKYLDFKFPVKLEVDSKSGPTWANCKE